MVITLFLFTHNNRRAAYQVSCCSFIMKEILLMKRKLLLTLGVTFGLAFAAPCTSFAANAASAATTMENCGAYLFEWRPVIFCNSGGRKYHQ